VALTIALMAIGNAVLDGSDRGIRKSYVDSFTGDLAVSEDTKERFSIFGSQTPIIGSLTSMPTIGSFPEVRKLVEDTKGVAASTPVVCGIVMLEAGAYSKPVSAFGIEGGSYFGIFPGLKVSEGAGLSGAKPGLMLTASRAAAIGEANKKPLSVGDPIVLGYYSAGHFQLREVPISGIISYPVQNDILGGIVLVDAPTLRSLLGLDAELVAGSGADAQGSTEASLDALFAGAKDVKAQPSAGLRLSDVEALLKEGGPDSDSISRGSSVWNYLLIRLQPGARSEGLAFSLDASLAAKGLTARTQDWRGTAGASALYVYWLRIIFNIGVFIVLAAGGLIIVNALVIAVFERTGEIGTMRALGASRSFVRSLFVAETMVLVLGSALVGIGIGALACAAIGARGIPIANQTAATLFGTSRLRPVVTLSSALFHAAAAALLGALAWIYPVRLALRIQPARAITIE